jgi:hypothetical protein
LAKREKKRHESDDCRLVEMCGELAIGGLQLLRQHSSPELAQLPTSQRGNGKRKSASDEYLLDGVNGTTRFAITQRGRQNL